MSGQMPDFISMCVDDLGARIAEHNKLLYAERLLSLEIKISAAKIGLLRTELKRGGFPLSDRESSD